MKTTVLYHDDTDGFCAAWVASKFLPDDTTYRAVNYGQDPPLELIEGRDVYILDFSYKRTKMIPIIELAASLVCLDHHRTAEAELADLPGCKFDVTRAGCRMALDFFEDRGLPNGDKWITEAFKRIEIMVDYVQDRDLWKFELSESRQVNAAVRSFPATFDDWNTLTDCSVRVLAKEGYAILRNEQRQVELILRNARQVTLGGHKVWAVNTPILQSECAGALAEKPFAIFVTGDRVNVKATNKFKPLFGVAWFQKADGRIVVNLRSRGEFDVSELARKFGGGGHKGAAGFETNMYADLFGPPDA